jgi:UrcA family protein
LANDTYSLTAVQNLQSLTEKFIKISNRFSLNLFTSIAVSSIVLGSVAAVTTAQAADENAALTKVVKYGDLDLNTAEGARTLQSRIHGAANTVCAPFESRSLAQKSRWQACYDQATASAVAHVDSTRLTAAHRKNSDSKPVG